MSKISNRVSKRHPDTPLAKGLLSVKIWMEGTYDMPYKNPYFFVTTEPNQMGVLLRCRYLVVV